MVEGLGNLVDFILTGGNVHDSTQAIELIDRVETLASIQTDAPITSALRASAPRSADKGYDAKAIVARVEALGALRAGATHPAVIPQLCNRKEPRPVDWAQYKNRNLVERFFARLKQFRRIATRYDKLVARFTSAGPLPRRCSAPSSGRCIRLARLRTIGLHAVEEPADAVFQEPTVEVDQQAGWTSR